jgi:threonine dehydratase
MQTSASTSSHHCISFQDVLDASERIKSIVHHTPVLSSASINSLCDNRNLFFKVEAMQRTGSFKFRGACNATLALVEKMLANKDSHHHDEIHVVTHSSGNHAAAVALAADKVSKKLGKDNFKIRATIVMPKNAPRIKVNGVKAFGGEIVVVENTNEAREEKADEIVEKEKATFIHPSENEYVIAGQGTVCLEMVEQVKEMLSKRSNTLDAVIIPVGGGGLASGNTIALRGLLGDNVKVNNNKILSFTISYPSNRYN